jgi:hypothetical protein
MVEPVRTVIAPPSSGIASDALVIRFMAIWRSCVGSPSRAGRAEVMSRLSCTRLEMEARSRSAISWTRPDRSTRSSVSRPRPE